MGDLAATTNEYAGTIRKANESLMNLSDSARQTARSMTDTSPVYQALGESSKTIETGGKIIPGETRSISTRTSLPSMLPMNCSCSGASDHVKKF
ncbi:MAG: hypothetical protein MZV63_47745 [Marinilabiliales bacterium]|nr:hypothetical protein [Marinilabiliales bacterium]